MYATHFFVVLVAISNPVLGAPLPFEKRAPQSGNSYQNIQRAGAAHDQVTAAAARWALTKGNRGGVNIKRDPQGMSAGRGFGAGVGFTKQGKTIIHKREE